MRINRELRISNVRILLKSCASNTECGSSQPTLREAGCVSHPICQEKKADKKHLGVDS